MLLICAVQAVSFVWTAIFRHRALRGNLMTTCAFLSRASHAHASLAQQRCRSPDSVPWSSPWAPPRRWTSRWTTSSRRRVRVRRVSVPRIVVVVPWSRPLAARVPIRPNSDVRPPPSSSILRRATGEEGAESREEEGTGAFTSRPLPPRRAIRSRRATRSSSRSGEFSSFIQFVRRTNYSALLRVRSNDSLTPPSSHPPAAPLAPLPAA